MFFSPLKTPKELIILCNKKLFPVPAEPVKKMFFPEVTKSKTFLCSSLRKELS
jgi:hypothetical protein